MRVKGEVFPIVLFWFIHCSYDMVNLSFGKSSLSNFLWQSRNKQPSFADLQKGPSNYHPVSLTLITCKIMKSILTKTTIITNLMREQHLIILISSMSIKRFTVTQILYYIESCAKAIADGDVVNIARTKKSFWINVANWYQININKFLLANYKSKD